MTAWLEIHPVINRRNDVIAGRQAAEAKVPIRAGHGGAPVPGGGTHFDSNVQLSDGTFDLSADRISRLRNFGRSEIGDFVFAQPAKIATRRLKLHLVVYRHHGGNPRRQAGEFKISIRAGRCSLNRFAVQSNQHVKRRPATVEDHSTADSKERRHSRSRTWTWTGTR